MDRPLHPGETILSALGFISRNSILRQIEPKYTIQYDMNSVWHIFIKNLGDDFLADNDSSFLDEIATPNAPTSNPGEDTGETDEFGLPRIPETAK